MKLMFAMLSTTHKSATFSPFRGRIAVVSTIIAIVGAIIASPCSTNCVSISATLIWSVAQLVRSAFSERSIATAMEDFAFTKWEEARSKQNSNNIDKGNALMEIPTLWLSCKEHAMKDRRTEAAQHCIDWTEIRSGNEPSKTLFEKLGIDLARPLLIPNLWRYASQHSNHLPLSLEDLTRPPLGNLSIAYFSDSSKVGSMQPDSVASLHEIVHNITKNNGAQKIGTQIPVMSQPNLIYNVAPTGEGVNDRYFRSKIAMV